MNKKISSALAHTTSIISPKLYIYLSYIHNRWRLPNLKNPKNVSEIVLSTMYSGRVNEFSDYVDKIKVREFYKDLGFEQYLPKIYGIWSNTNEIDFNNLPNAFALKTNHGCGNHYICKNKNELDVEIAKKTISKALKTKYGLAETHYHSIKPMIYCEEYINDGTGNLPTDYKFLCTDGEIKCILVINQRTKTSVKKFTYNTKWEKLDYLRSHYNITCNFPMPKNLKIMINIANRISKKFEFVRIDFYDTGEKLFLGELTFTPQGGIMSSFNYAALKEMGRK